MAVSSPPPDALDLFQPPTVDWFRQVFHGPTAAQSKAWPEISAGRNTLLLAPTGSGKTLAAFLTAIDRIMFDADQNRSTGDDTNPPGVRTLYISPLKALGVDVERNLKAPLAGIRAAADRLGHTYCLPGVGVRSGDTPAAERTYLVRNPPEILITTPESLFLLLTSRARQILTGVESVIIDEIHSLVANKRGAHLFVSLERLERLRAAHNPHARPLQRIGLSATQRPLDEVARLLGGAKATADPDAPPVPREVAIVEAGRRKSLDLEIVVPVEDMTRLAEAELPSGPASAGPGTPSIWPAIHPKLVELIRQHRSTMIFVNSRRLAERLANSLNELADKEIALAHHGSIAKDTRLRIEDRLKRGQLPAIVATSSLELGIDMGAVDLVIQIEAPPSIASGLQRIGRAGHQVEARSKGIVFPKFRGDLLACSAAAGRMLKGEVEATYCPRNPLDVLAQQLVAMVALESCTVDELYATVRSSAPFTNLTRSSFEHVLDLLAGRYPSDEFSELRPRLNWDRINGLVSPRKGTQRLAILNAGTIPDRGLYGVFLADGEGSEDPRRSRRVGELDEEMVFETRPGDVFMLGASSWRVMDITNDRVLVVPAPGEPGRMPFWKGDGPGRPLEFGKAIGKLTRELAGLTGAQAERELTTKHCLDTLAARNLVDYVQDQTQATEAVPSDENVVVECFLDEIGDWRLAVLSPFGARVHAPWALAILSRLQSETGRDIDLMWTDDGILFRLPESESLPPTELLFPSASEVENIVVEQLGSTALFASRFRENAARSLLLPKRQPGRRTPLWLQRRRSADLLSVAARYDSFPIMLETYRECLRDVFDLRGLKSILQDVSDNRIRITRVENSTPSPFSASLLFNYVGNFIYDGDAPLAEKRAAALALDHTQLREILGDADLREMIPASAVEEIAGELQLLNYPIRDADGLHDTLLRLGDLSERELSVRTASLDETRAWLTALQSERRIVQLLVDGEERYIAAEDMARYRDALGIVSPPGLPEAFLESVNSPLTDLVARFARTHPPFKPEDVTSRLGIPVSLVTTTLQELVKAGRVVQGEFLPGGRGYEFCDAGVLKKLKRRSLAHLRKQIEPVEAKSLSQFICGWHQLERPRKGLDGILDAVEQLQGYPIAVSDLERRVLPARVKDYQPADLDELCAAGEVVWQGVEGLGPHDGRVALYLADQVPSLGRIRTPLEGDEFDQLRGLLQSSGALFFDALQRQVGTFRHELLDLLWQLVWNGELTNDTLTPLRSRRNQATASRGFSGGRRFRSRRQTRLPGSEGRWSLLPILSEISPTERQAALANQLLMRYGVLTRELVGSEVEAGGFAGLYPVFKAMEESGRIRRGYFVAGLGAAQFAVPGAEDRLRSHANDGEKETTVVLAACDPANLYGTALRWPVDDSDVRQRPARAAGARVILANGKLIGYLNRTAKQLSTYLAEEEPERTKAAQLLATTLGELAENNQLSFLEKIDGRHAPDSDFAQSLAPAGFVATSRGLMFRRRREPISAQPARRLPPHA